MGNLSVGLDALSALMLATLVRSNRCVFVKQIGHQRPWTGRSLRLILPKNLCISVFIGTESSKDTKEKSCFRVYV